MALRAYLIEWITNFRDETTESCVIRAEDAKDAIVMFEAGWRYKGGVPQYTITAVEIAAIDAPPRRWWRRGGEQ